MQEIPDCRQSVNLFAGANHRCSAQFASFKFSGLAGCGSNEELWVFQGEAGISSGHPKAAEH
jgi:hypothetical protein